MGPHRLSLTYVNVPLVENIGLELEYRFKLSTLLRTDSSKILEVQKYSITVTGPPPVDLLEVRPIIESAIKVFESKITPLHGIIKISIGDLGCMRVGYDFTSDMVNFCNSKI